MNTKKIVAGVMSWSVGFLLPALYHSVLMHAVAQDGRRYSYHDMTKYFFDLPWIVWPYIIAMAIVGGILVVSGVKDKNN